MAPVSAPTTTKSLTAVEASDIAALAAGCAIFGTGGGGAVYTSNISTERSLTEHGPVPLKTVDDLDADDTVILMSGIGAPTVGIEMLSSADQMGVMVREAERMLGRPITALMAAEIGGSNGIGPVGWAARLGLPVLDADGMGRAFPKATMVAMNVAGVPCDISVMADVVGNVVTHNTVDIAWLERHARA
ncbi:MAG: S-methyl thiohydantoin desulfurase domain-containing protein, partial [Agrococcus casei]